MISFNLRVEEKTHAKISKIAEIQNRSLNKQVIHLIEQYIKDYEKINGEVKTDK